MKTTTQIVDEELEFFRDKAYIEAERYEKETNLMREIFEMKQAEVVLGKVRKRKKASKHATITTKLPRFIRIQFDNRRILATPYPWD